MTWEKIIKGFMTGVGLGFIGWGLWEYDPRVSMITIGLGLFLMGVGKI